jgi:ribosomal protein L29
MKRQDSLFLTREQLRDKVDEVRRELFSLRLNAMSMHVKDCSQFKKKRRVIARLLTYMAQK